MGKEIIVCSVQETSDLDDTSKATLENNSACDFILPDKAHQQNLANFFELPLPEILFDPSVEDTLRKYLDAQTRLDKLRTEFANRIYLPYVCSVKESNQKYHSELNFYFNNQKVTKLPFYAYQGTYRAVSVTGFKTILITLGNPYAKWISNNNKLFIDVLNYALDNGIQFTTTDSSIKLDYTQKK